MKVDNFILLILLSGTTFCILAMEKVELKWEMPKPDLNNYSVTQTSYQNRLNNQEKKIEKDKKNKLGKNFKKENRSKGALTETQKKHGESWLNNRISCSINKKDETVDNLSTNLSSIITLNLNKDHNPETFLPSSEKDRMDT